jgi:hypothetical protein
MIFAFHDLPGMCLATTFGGYVPGYYIWRVCTGYVQGVMCSIVAWVGVHIMTSKYNFTMYNYTL